MKLFSFRIYNYKSIEDSKECYVANKITIFAGKNGSGKSNVMQALHKFSTKEFNFAEDNYNYGEDKPIISTTFILDSEEIKEIQKTYNVSIENKINVVLDTNKDEKVYSINAKVNIEKFLEHNKKILDGVEKIIGKPIDNKENINIEDIFGILKEELSEEEANKYIENIKEKKYINIVDLEKAITDHIFKKIPTFIYQKTIETELTSILSIDSVKNNDFHKDLYKLMDLTEKDFDQQVDLSSRGRRTTQLSTKLTGDFGSFYSQDKIDLMLSLDTDKVLLQVTEPGKASFIENKIENKSDGLRWFIAFYTKLTVTKSENIIILLDEPGMYLHAKACSEMTEIFEEISKESQILMATHNPYLIKADSIGNVRLVLNDCENSTIIENKPHKYQQDKNMDALTPILTSIGYSLTMSIHVGDQNKNIITEGISDYYLIIAMAKILRENVDYLIIPSSSADKINYIASILIGWGLKVGVILDTDKKGKEKQKELEYITDFCIPISDFDNNSIEDIFSKKDYTENVLGETTVYSCANSKIKKEIKIDEVQKAKEFYDKVSSKKIKLEQETIDNFKSLFLRIKAGFDK